METWKLYSQNLHEEIPLGIAYPQTACEGLLLLLHGYKGDMQDMFRRLPVQAYADAYHLLAVCPSLGDGYYIDHPGRDYGAFLARELPQAIRRRFFDCPDRTLLAGISMGGYGSLLTACHYPEAFCDVICISAAFIAKDVSMGNASVVGDPNDRAAVRYFLDTFGPDVSDLNEAPERNPIAALPSLRGREMPRIWLTCGTEDFLYPHNCEAVEALKANGLSYHWNPLPGDHVFPCFDSGIRAALDSICNG